MASNQSQVLGALDPTPDRVAEPDPELLALPSPPKRDRALTIGVMVITSIAAALLAWSLWSEAAYALKPGTPRELGDLTRVALEPDLANTYVRGTGLLGTQGAIRYGRAAEGDSFRLAPVAGHDRLWVEIRVPEGFEGPRFIPPTQFAGRVVPFSRAGLRHAGLRGAVTEETGAGVPPDAWILIDGSSPRASRWALVLVVLLAGFSAWNVLGVVRLLHRVRDPRATRSEGT